MPDYSNGQIYKVTCETGKVYIGSTVQNLRDRFYSHKKTSNYCVSKDFINPKIELIESYPCETKQQLLWKEREWIEKTECVNTQCPIISEEEKRTYKKEFARKTEKGKMTCECGITVLKGNIWRHKQTKKHQSFLASKTNM